MLGRNDTPFAAIGFEQAHRDGMDMGVVAVRASYVLSPDATLSLADEQAVVLVDEYEGNPHRTPLLRTSDLVPFKPGTDVTALANAYAPGDRPLATWRASIAVGARRHEVRVSGPRDWRRTATGLIAGPPEPVRAVAIDWRFAWSDLAQDELADGEVAPFNPIGVRRPISALEGRLDAEAQSLALVNDPQETDDDPNAKRTPQGFGPIPPFWRARQRFAGTYDDDWLATRHPQLPPDFDYCFYQAAPPGLVLPSHLRGDEEIVLASLLPSRERFAFAMPGVQPVACFAWTDGREVEMRLNLDGVHMDFRAPPMRVDLTWRAWLPVCPSFLQIDLRTERLDHPDLVELPRSGLHGIEGINEFGAVVHDRA